MGFNRIFGSLVDINRNFMLVGFGGILMSVDFGGFFRFWFGVIVRGNV